MLITGELRMLSTESIGKTHDLLIHSVLQLSLPPSPGTVHCIYHRPYQLIHQAFLTPRMFQGSSFGADLSHFSIAQLGWCSFSESPNFAGVWVAIDDLA